MSYTFRKNVVRSLFLSFWAMATLILVFVVILLIRDIASNGRDPLGAFTVVEEETPQPQRAAPSRNTLTGEREVRLFFGANDGLHLLAESRQLPTGESTVENCRTALEALIKGPLADGTAILPPTVNVKALYLLPHGELVINFSRELQAEYTRSDSASAEALFVQGVVHTVIQPSLQNNLDPNVRKVRILVEDAPPTEAFPAHIDLIEPVAPDVQWLPARG